MRVQLGHVTHTWGDVPFERVLDEVREIGYVGVEPFNTHVAKWYDDPGTLEALLRERQLKLSSVYYEAPLIREDEIEGELEEGLRAARLLRALGAKHLMVGPGPMPEGGVADMEYHLMASALNRLGESCLELGVELCYHPHVGGTVENREQIRTIFERTDPAFVFFVPDTGHLAKGGSDPVEVVEAYLDRIRFVHLKDMTDDKTFVELGRGSIDNQRVLQLLTDGGYEGWILPEIPPRDLSPKESAAVSYRHLLEMLARV